jgi:hypothetical protein
MTEIVSILWRPVLFALGRVSPTALVRRLLPLDRLDAAVETDLKSTHGAEVVLSGTVPSVRLALRFFNRTAIHVQLQRIHVDLWFGQPTVRTWEWVDRTVGPVSGIDRLSMEFMLTEGQLAQIRSQIREGRLDCTVSLTVTPFVKCAAWEGQLKPRRLEIPAHQIGGIY